ncbi:MAG: Ribosome maturation factor RimP [Firmicutes bacterium ADurb.Bin300]|nr:MAG: Ribosome maturation factor RimP [Firmicutes bacterium ADurb.Bin300]HOD01784.1 ribosome maturation factor RimP [Clostridiales bacterium]
MGKNTVFRVWEIAEPIAEELGLILWDVRFVKEGANYYLRIYIDKQGGVSLDDCVKMSHALDAPLDEADFIESSYNMQVSSPGIERELTRDFHFESSIGSPVLVKLIRPFNGQREFKGILSGYKDGEVSVVLEGETHMTAAKKEIAFVRLDDFNS